MIQENFSCFWFCRLQQFCFVYVVVVVVVCLLSHKISKNEKNYIDKQTAIVVVDDNNDQSNQTD